MNLSRATGLPPRTITKLTQKQGFSKSNMEVICGHLLPEDAEYLCLSICHDVLPDEVADTVQFSDSNSRAVKEGLNYGPKLDDYTERTLLRLRKELFRDPETRAWLCRIGKWLGVPHEPGKASKTAKSSTSRPPKKR